MPRLRSIRYGNDLGRYDMLRLPFYHMVRNVRFAYAFSSHYRIAPSRSATASREVCTPSQIAYVKLPCNLTQEFGRGGAFANRGLLSGLRIRERFRTHAKNTFVKLQCNSGECPEWGPLSESGSIAVVLWKCAIPDCSEMRLPALIKGIRE